jgi:arylsulfatase A-like enzyme
VEALDAGPNADNTWIVVWSDHGWSLGEKEHWGKHVPWRESVRMPLIIVPPKGGAPAGFVAGTRCAAPVSLLDLYPTLVEVCGLPGREELEGRSLMPLIADVDGAWEEAVVTTIGRGTHSVATGDWRYVRYFDGSEELYDLRKDEREWNNVAGEEGYEAVKAGLGAEIREDEGLRQFVRWGRWKCVFPVEGEAMLFDYQGVFGISEQTDLAGERPEVVARIREYLEENGITDRRVVMPEE